MGRALRLGFGGLLYASGLLVGTLSSLSVVESFAADGLDANLGWGGIGILLLQPPATLATIIGTALLWSPGVADGRLHRARFGVRTALALGVLWTFVAYGGLYFHNSGC
jgi:hypothetical protein